MKNRRWFSVIAILLLACQTILILCSWIVGAAKPEWSVHSLLSTAGIRWMFGSFTGNTLTPVLLWIVLSGMSWNIFCSSGLCQAIRRPYKVDYRCRTALGIALGQTVIAIAILAFLTLPPHAILSGVTGHLYPSRLFSNAVPTLLLVSVIISATYGLASGTYKSIHEIFPSLAKGVSKTSPLVIIYILLIQFIKTVEFVFTTY